MAAGIGNKDVLTTLILDGHHARTAPHGHYAITLPPMEKTSGPSGPSASMKAPAWGARHLGVFDGSNRKEADAMMDERQVAQLIGDLPDWDLPLSAAQLRRIRAALGYPPLPPPVQIHWPATIDLRRIKRTLAELDASDHNWTRRRRPWSVRLPKRS